MEVRSAVIRIPGQRFRALVKSTPRELERERVANPARELYRMALEAGAGAFR
jgi:hypothetical protein